MVKIKRSDTEMGLLGALSVAIPIFVINLTGGVLRALGAFAGQFVYSFLVISYNNSICRRLSHKSIILATAIPTILTTALTYCLHIIIRSPEPFWSAAFAFISALPSFLVLSYRYKWTEKTLWELCKECYRWIRKKNAKKHKH